MLLTDECFDVPLELPFPVGTSPFRQKGHVYRGNFDFIKHVVPGGLAAVRATLPTPALIKFFEQRFTVSEWYDSLPNIYLQEAVARARGLSFAEQARQNGVHHARERIKGFFNLLLKVASTESVAVWAPRIPTMYYSFAQFRTQIIGDRHVALIASGIPMMLARWIGAVFEGTVIEMISSAGGHDVRVSFPHAEPEGTIQGQPLWRLEGEVTWK